MTDPALSRAPVGITEFLDAHHRHWRDAEFLFADARLANADQLYGFCAECGLKAVMVRFGMRIDDRGRPEKPYRIHLPELWPLFEAFVARQDARRNLPDFPEENPFRNWTVEDRYRRADHATTTFVEHHRTGARNVVQMVRSLMRDSRGE